MQPPLERAGLAAVVALSGSTRVLQGAASVWPVAVARGARAWVQRHCRRALGCMQPLFVLIVDSGMLRAVCRLGPMAVALARSPFGAETAASFPRRDEVGLRSICIMPGSSSVPMTLATIVVIFVIVATRPCILTVHCIAVGARVCMLLIACAMGVAGPAPG